ncbi:uncharacterized protein LY89DRAFT_789598 [Mollisia scopiformis]|uniref:Uncharacterized protein n=1 Tax=Mollisia scopiformis TaxID=149040 RepID=A0A132B583_MOLSC|nr:uncharacterized protein LY89DRAFT_789598 [Mollisia scopiformis]KUJ07501.1 hypothetical protein LY89DRAFT_789598 [Mollisia scopiformis]
MPLVRNIPRSEARWSKFKSAYMWGNKEYYLRRTKFAVYQLATTNVNLVVGMGIAVLRDYKGLSAPADFPNATIKSTNIVYAIAGNTAAALLVSVLFGTAVFFELFWPEREESTFFQWCVKLAAACTAIFQAASASALTYIVVKKGIEIHGVSAADEASIRANWSGPALEYKHDTLALVVIAFSFIQLVFNTWSVLVMWKAYAHNNKYGPFKHHERKGRGSETASLELSTGHV